MPAEIIPFPRCRTKAHELHAPDGRWWCASAYIWPAGLARMKSGRDYTPDELVRLYGLPRFKSTGKPGLYLKPGEELPKTVRYVVYALATGGEL